MSSPDEFAQLKLNFIDPVQHHYEVIRPVVLFGETVAARSQQTGVAPTQISDKARRFVAAGMFALADQRPDHAGRPAHDYPAPIAATILYLKQLYPPIHFREIVRIVARKHGYTTNHSTVKRFLARYPIPVQLPLEWKPFHQFDDAYRARWTVVRMWAEGWSKKSIAGCLKLSRKHVHTIITAFEQDGFAGLEDQRTRPPDHPANQLTLPLMHEILDIQREYPHAGRFRVHGLLEQRFQAQGRAEAVPSERTVGRAMAKNRQFHHAPGPWASDAPPDPTAKAVKALPYQPAYRHQYWFVDIRYTTRVANQRTYSICILEGYSRTLLAGMASPYQDLIAVLQLLAAAIGEYGCPAGIVSDNGAVFTSHAYRAVLEALEIEPCYIEKGNPWQNLIEAAFKVEARLADPIFAQAQSLEDLQSAHAQFLETYNTTAHWAHQDRADGLRTPVEVLGWVRGRVVEPDTLRQVLRQLQVERVVDRRGYVSIQRFAIYAERGLARQRVSIWLYEGRLHIDYQQTVLARYAYRYDRKRRRLRAVGKPQLYATAFADPQLELWELDDEQWRKVLSRPVRPRRVEPVAAMAHLEQLAFQLVG